MRSFRPSYEILMKIDYVLILTGELLRLLQRINLLLSDFYFSPLVVGCTAGSNHILIRHKCIKCIKCIK